MNSHPISTMYCSSFASYAGHDGMGGRKPFICLMLVPHLKVQRGGEKPLLWCPLKQENWQWLNHNAH